MDVERKGRKGVKNREVGEGRKEEEDNSQVLDKAERRARSESRAERGEGEDEDTGEREQTQEKHSNSHGDHIHSMAREGKCTT